MNRGNAELVLSIQYGADCFSIVASNASGRSYDKLADLAEGEISSSCVFSGAS